MQRSIIN